MCGGLECGHLGYTCRGHWDVNFWAVCVGDWDVDIWAICVGCGYLGSTCREVRCGCLGYICGCVEERDVDFGLYVWAA